MSRFRAWCLDDNSLFPLKKLTTTTNPTPVITDITDRPKVPQIRQSSPSLETTKFINADENITAPTHMKQINSKRLFVFEFCIAI
jgi:hypothetical protein